MSHMDSDALSEDKIKPLPWYSLGLNESKFTRLSTRYGMLSQAIVLGMLGFGV